MIVEPVSVTVFPQYEAHHIILTVQPDLVRKDMRHKTRLFLYGIKMDTALDDLRDEGHGSGQKCVEAMGKRIPYPLWRDLYIPAGIHICGGRPIGEPLPRPYLDSFPQGFGLFGRLSKGSGINSPSRPEPLRAVGLDQGHGRKALLEVSCLRRRLIQRWLRLTQIDQVGVCIYPVIGSIGCGYVFQRPQRGSSPGGPQPRLHFLPVHITGIFFELPHEPMVGRYAAAFLAVGTFYDVDMRLLSSLRHIQSHRHHHRRSVGVGEFQHEDQVALGPARRAVGIEHGDGVSHGRRDLLPHLRRHVGMRAVKNVRRGIDAALGSGLAGHGIPAQQLHDQRRLPQHLYRIGRKFPRRHDVVHGHTEIMDVTFQAGAGSIPHGRLFVQCGLPQGITIRVFTRQPHASPPHQSGGIHAVGRLESTGLRGVQLAVGLCGLLAHQWHHLPYQTLLFLPYGIRPATTLSCVLDHGLHPGGIVRTFRFLRIGSISRLPQQRCHDRHTFIIQTGMQGGEFDLQIHPGFRRLSGSFLADAQRREHVLSLPGQVKGCLRRDVHGLGQHPGSIVQCVLHVVWSDLLCLAGFHGAVQLDILADKIPGTLPFQVTDGQRPDTTAKAAPHGADQAFIQPFTIGLCQGIGIEQRPPEPGYLISRICPLLFGKSPEVRYQFRVLLQVFRHELGAHRPQGAPDGVPERSGVEDAHETVERELFQRGLHNGVGQA